MTREEPPADLTPKEWVEWIDRRYGFTPYTDEEYEAKMRELLSDAPLSPRRSDRVAQSAPRSHMSRDAPRVTRRQLMARVERALDRNSDALDRNAEAFDRHAAAADRNAAAFDRNAEVLTRVVEEHSLAMREMTLRVEKVGKEIVREIRESRESWSAELREEMQYQRRIMARILDRLPPTDDPA